MEAIKNYRKGDIVYMSLDCGQHACPAEYIGRFKNRFGMTGWVYYFKPIGSPKPYVVIRINANELDGETTELIPFSLKPGSFGKVKR